MEAIFNVEILGSFIVLCFLEIILGIDNLIFISIVSGKLPDDERRKAQFVGLSLSLIFRLGLLFTINWIMSLTQGLFVVFGNDISGRDLVLLSGGLFLLYKSANEIHEKTKPNAHEDVDINVKASFMNIVFQIVLLDIIFSLDSVVTAVGTTNNFWVMAAAIIVAIIVMMLSINYIGDIVNSNPSIKILALSFLLLIGMTLIGEGLDMHVPKGYVYFAMGFGLFVELINIRADNQEKKKLNK